MAKGDKCCVKTCSYAGSINVSSKYCAEYKLYCFPKCPRMRQKWNRILKVSPKFSESSKICSRHFEEKCFQGNRKLKTNAKPSLFLEKPESLIKEEAKLLYKLMEEVIENEGVKDMPMLVEDEMPGEYIEEDMVEVKIKEEPLDLQPPQQSIDLDLPASKESKIDIQIDFDQENPEVFQKPSDHKPPSSSVFLQDFFQDRKVEKEKLFFCRKCKKNFASHGELREHISSHYRGPEPLKVKCPHCVKMFENESNLKMHVTNSHRFGPEENIFLIQHEGKSTGKCDYCPTHFYSEQCRIDHMNSVHLGQKYDCDICGKSYTNKSTLTAHKKVEHSALQEMWKCDFEFCDKTFKTRQIMKQHQRDVHTEFRIACDLCPAKFKSKLSLDRHLRKIHNEVYKCDFCWRAMSSIEAWRAHMLKRHPTETIKNDMKKGKKNLKETEEDEEDNEKEFEVQVKAEKIDIVENEIDMDNTKAGNDNTVVKTEPNDLQEDHSEPKTGLEELIDFDLRSALKIKKTESKQRKLRKILPKTAVPDSAESDYHLKAFTEKIDRYQKKNGKIEVPKNERDAALNGRPSTVKDLILAAISAMKSKRSSPDSSRIFNWINRRYDRSLNEVEQELERLVGVGELSRTKYGDRITYCIIQPDAITEKHQRIQKAAAPRQKLVQQSHERPFVCNVCRRAFKENSNLLNHRKNCTGEKQFVKEISRSPHSRSLHKRTSKFVLPKKVVPDSVECDVCQRTFKQKSHLNIHRTIHTREKQFNKKVVPDSVECDDTRTESVKHNLKIDASIDIDMGANLQIDFREFQRKDDINLRYDFDQDHNHGDTDVQLNFDEDNFEIQSRKPDEKETTVDRMKIKEEPEFILPD